MVAVMDDLCLTKLVTTVTGDPRRFATPRSLNADRQMTGRVTDLVEAARGRIRVRPGQIRSRK